MINSKTRIDKQDKKGHNGWLCILTAMYRTPNLVQICKTAKAALNTEQM